MKSNFSFEAADVKPKTKRPGWYYRRCPASKMRNILLLGVKRIPHLDNENLVQFQEN